MQKDTLYLFPWEGKIKSKQFDQGISISYNNVTVSAPQIKSIIGKKDSHVNLYKLEYDTLTIDSNGSKIFYDFLKSMKPRGLLNIIANRGGFISVNNLNVENIKIELNQSELRIIDSEVQALSGSIVKSSRLVSYRSINNLNLTTDSTSTYDLEKKVFKAVTNERVQKVE